MHERMRMKKETIIYGPIIFILFLYIGKHYVSGKYNFPRAYINYS